MTIKSVSFLILPLFCNILYAAEIDSIPRRQEAQSDSFSKKPNIFFFFADDWGKYVGSYDNFPPNKVIKTPVMDEFAREGIQFNNAYVNAPACTPCRSSLLSGQYFYRTGLGANLWGVWDSTIPSYPLILEETGYDIGYSYKCWGPGRPVNAPHGGEAKAYQSAGIRFNEFSQNVTQMVNEGKTIEEAKEELYKEGLDNFRSFLKSREEGSPFCYWFGPMNTHRKWIEGSGKNLWGLNPDDLIGLMPSFLPDVHEIREDMTDYFGEVLALDEMLGRLLKELEEIGEMENTLFVVSGDHGIPGFPRAKSNLYPLGTDVPLLVQWPGVIKGGREIDDFISLMDLAPTFLEVAGVSVPESMTGKSIAPLLKSKKSGIIDDTRNYVVTGRERHVPAARDGNLPYPQRSIQTEDFLYIINFAPDRYPMGAPYNLDGLKDNPVYEELKENTLLTYADIDAGPTKAWMIKHRDDNKWKMHWKLGFEMRSSEELYDLKKDPDYLNNVAYDPEYSHIKEKLSTQLMQILKSTGDPRVTSDGNTFDRLPYTAPR
ncbi:MAG: sulfatase [Bacteroidales bacterium]